MGKFSKLLNAMGIPTEEEFDEAEEVVYEKEPAPTGFIKRGKVVNINATTQYQVVVVQPETFDEAKEIADHLKDRRPVVSILNLWTKILHRKFLTF